MICRSYTLETRLNISDDVKDYFIKLNEIYKNIYVKCWHLIESNEYKRVYKKNVFLISRLIKKFNVSKSLINSAVYDAQTRHKAMWKIKCRTKDFFTIKLQNVLKEINILKVKADTYKFDDISNLEDYKKIKKQIYVLNVLKNKLINKLKKINNEIRSNVLNVGIGGKDIFKAQYDLINNGFNNHEEWYMESKNNVENKFCYVGDKTIYNGNSHVFLKYNEDSNDFSVKLSLENTICERDYFYFNNLKFKYLTNYLIDALKRTATNEALSYRFLRRNNKWYIQVTIKIIKNGWQTSKDNGAIGLDFNYGFIAMTEINGSGNIVDIKKYPLNDRGTKKGDTFLEQTIAKIVNLCLIKKKPLVIEDLDFVKSKSKVITNKYEHYISKNINSFEYNKYMGVCESAAFKNDVELIYVDPAYTSKIGKEKYAEKKKLSIHHAAGYVIARRGIGFNDKTPIKI